MYLLKEILGRFGYFGAQASGRNTLIVQHKE